jgi:hypothetical protein
VATSERFPKAYDATVKRDDALLVYTTFDKMGIGARGSGLPKEASAGPKSLEHVGKSVSGSGNSK